MSKKIYILDDDVLFSRSLTHYLSSNGHENVSVFQTSQTLLEEKDEFPDVLILDHFLTNEIGLNILEKIQTIWPKTRVIYLSGQEKVNIAIESIKKGAYAYVEKNSIAYSKIKGLIDSEIIDGSYLL